MFLLMWIKCSPIDFHIKYAYFVSAATFLSMHQKFTQPYNPQDTEKNIYQVWEKSGYFTPENLPERHQAPWSCIMPPPNANGRLHVGHALDIALKDAAARFERMRGKKVLLLPGADHAGFETQVVYEKKLEKEGRSRFGMEPQQLYDEIYKFTIENKQAMVNDVRRLGTSCDWSRERFTLDDHIVKKVQQTFVKMYEDGLVYRGKRTINWCPKHQTSLSDVETSSVEEMGKFYYLKYGPFVIGTSRPETKFGDKYVVMHPDDERYKQYEHGQKFELEWINGPITATVLKDPVIDMKFGTGVMTITPWHDNVDFEMAQRHHLDMEQVIDWRGKLLPIAGEFAGMKILEARAKIIEKLAAKGLVEKIDENYVHVVKRCYKCETLIEPQIRDQWFVKMEPLAAKVIEAVETKEQIKIVPDYEKKILLHWMHNTIDWNISRQIIWGIPIPAWFKGDEAKVALESPGEGWERDPDTFDTWFSSGQWPLLTLGYPENADFKTYYPTNLMETGADLVFKWVPRMIMFGTYLAGDIPFKTVYFHGMVNDPQNKKMSKSKGNVISPVDMADKFGTDALRMALIVGNPAGSNVPLSEDKIKGYKHFTNKVWNITRFVLTAIGDTVPDTQTLAESDKAILNEIEALAKDITLDLEEYRYYMAAEKIYHYIWHRFADVIIEESKPILTGTDESAKKSRQFALYTTLTTFITLLHPFMPYVTEEIWSSLPGQEEGKLLMITPWPVA